MAIRLLLVAAVLLVNAVDAFQGGAPALSLGGRSCSYAGACARRPLMMAAGDSEGDLRQQVMDQVGRRAVRLVAGATAAVYAAAPALAEEVAAAQEKFVPRGITTEDTAVFVIGCIPFVWATISFWTRIANGQPFGTGKDSVVFETDRKDWAVEGAGSRRILSAGAMRIAYFLMAAAGISVAGVFYLAAQLPAT